ncbi:receptor-like protein kinase precursor [Seminavis robusta]|uniref:Receptor-like protein kinase n=1 Tax=Seminavis robusta TaxID=568900 RepID=A0A9N8D846_9STRA|nr:receptor-like protein kinase precursor [Seminavis robusta]|eukprot:Sro32_g021050.1 receptor-like protein kinase precursor (796) ;mRNA; f:142657-145044
MVLEDTTAGVGGSGIGVPALKERKETEMVANTDMIRQAEKDLMTQKLESFQHHVRGEEVQTETVHLRMAVLRNTGVLEDDDDENDDDRLQKEDKILALEETTKAVPPLTSQQSRATGTTAQRRLQILMDTGVIEETECSGTDNRIVHKSDAMDKLEKNVAINNVPVGAAVTEQILPRAKTDSRLHSGSHDDSGGGDSENPDKNLRDCAPPPTQLAQGSQILRTEGVPGAYYHAPSWRQDDSVRASLNDASLVFGIDQDDQGNTRTNEEGLAEASPVCISTEFAEPIDVSEHRAARQQRYQKDLSRTVKFVLVGVVVLILIGIGLAVGLALRDSSSTERDSTKQHVKDTNGTMAPTQVDTSWHWDLPFTIPNTTLHFLHRDVDAAVQTPLYQAYQWMKEDPYIDTYSDARLLQRFVMALFYYSTIGESWTEQGGGTATVLADVITTLELSAAGVPAREARNSGQLPDNGDDQSDPKPEQSSSQCCAIGSKPSRRHEFAKVNITMDQWLSYEHSECNWFFTSPLRYPTVCNQKDQLQFFDLMHNNLMGRLPEEISLLSSLEVLNVGRNKIHGPILTQIGNLKKLREFHLVTNDFIGSIPSEIGLLSGTLEIVSVIDNDLSGSLPPEFWALSHMKELKIDKNGLSGTFPSDIGFRMPHLLLFMVARNRFTGTLPTSIGQATDLFRLGIQYNEITGAVPSELGLLVNITTVHASGNLFSGTLPSEIGLWTNLVDLRIDQNPGITGPVPPELWNLNETLHILQLHGTGVTGTIPEEICGSFGYFSFDCSTSLCGCDCPCQ